MGDEPAQIDLSKMIERLLAARIAFRAEFDATDKPLAVFAPILPPDEREQAILEAIGRECRLDG